MKWWSNSYHMLISSLPALPPRFDVERLPITFERLQGRLRMLEPEDAEEIERMLAVLRWGNQFEEPSDAAVVQRYDALMQDITNPLVRDILAYGDGRAHDRGGVALSPPRPGSSHGRRGPVV